MAIDSKVLSKVPVLFCKVDKPCEHFDATHGNLYMTPEQLETPLFQGFWNVHLTDHTIPTSVSLAYALLTHQTPFLARLKDSAGKLILHPLLNEIFLTTAFYRKVQVQARF